MEDDQSIDPLVMGFDRTADGAVTEVNWNQLSTSAQAPENSQRWVHLNRLSPDLPLWFDQAKQFDPLVVEALLQEDTRPRVTRIADGVLINLRGVNLTEESDDNPMISIRIWLTDQLMVSTRAYRIMAAEDLAERYRSGQSPERHGEALVFLISRLTARLERFVQSFEEEADQLEEVLLDPGASLTSATLSTFRRSVLSVRRYIIPQREAISALIKEDISLLSDQDRLRLRQVQDDITRLAEDLDVIRERAQVLQDQIIEQRNEAMNLRLFLLAVVSAIFLPLGFITGLFGVNVGGMPGVDSALGFTLLSLGIVASAGLIWVGFKRMGWV